MKPDSRWFALARPGCLLARACAASLSITTVVILGGCRAPGPNSHPAACASGHSPAPVLPVLLQHADPLAETPVADSTTSFSTQQGFGGWEYGYFAMDNAATPRQLLLGDALDYRGMFVPMTQVHDATWYAQRGEGGTWTMLSQSLAHPNGRSTTWNRRPVEQWVVRRWTSPMDVDALVVVRLGDVAAPCGNGVVGWVLYNGLAIARTDLEDGDAWGEVTTLNVRIARGDVFDFVIESGEGDDRCDATLQLIRILRAAPSSR